MEHGPPGLLKRSLDISGRPRENLQPRLFRISIIAGAGSAVYGLIDVVSAAWSGPPRPEDPILMGVCALISFFMALLSRKSSIPTSTLMDLGYSYQVLLCAIISLAEAMNSRQTGDSVWGVSWVCVAMVAFPAILPYRRFPMMVAATLSALSGPLMYLIATPFQGKALNIGDALNMYIPNFITLGIASSTIFFLSNWAKKMERMRLMGSYRLVDCIGAGGMGEVWLAEHETLARPAAVKLIRAKVPGWGEQAEEVERRFFREASITANLSSPYTVTVFDYGVTRGGDQYYVMELLEGITLEDAVNRFGPMGPERVSHLLAQMCHSLAEAHRAGLIHRDVKPANIFVCQKGVEYDFVKVLDFGLVKPHIDSQTLLTVGPKVLGTPTYLAPEAAKGLQYDQRSDIYSLGCVAYFMLTGERVFSADTVVDMILKHTNEAPVPVTKRAPSPVPEDLNALIMRCLEKKSEDRPATCIEILEKLEQIEIDCRWTRKDAAAWWGRNMCQ